MRGLLLAGLLFGSNVMAETTAKNMDFSELSNNLPAHWVISGTETPVISKQPALGNITAVQVSRTGNTEGEYADVSQMISFPYSGKTLRLSGYLRTKNVSAQGYAGFWLYQTTESSDTAQYNDMEVEAVNGSNDWQRYTLTAELHADTEALHFGVMQVGTGQTEMAQLTLTLDEQPIEQAPLKQRPIFTADLPHQFEQDSGLRFTALSKTQQDNLAALAKVWGFIKYYHPESAAGNLSMDAELFRLIPAVMSVDNNARDKLLTQWINSLGELHACNSCKNSSDAALVHAEQHWLSWQLSASLNQALAKVYAAQLPEKHYWVKPTSVGSPQFNEKPYNDISSEDTGFRLLAVFRFWNMIHYYSPNRHLTEQPWEQVLATAIAEVVGSTTETDYLLALSRLIYAVHDSHTQLTVKNDALSGYIGKNMVPAEVRFVEGKPIVYQVHQAAPALQVGDIITHINDKPVSDRIEHLRPIAAGSNQPTQHWLIARYLLRANAEQLALRVTRQGKSIPLQLTLVDSSTQRRSMAELAHYNHGDQAYQVLDDNIGYIRLDKMEGQSVNQMMTALANTKGLIIDIRSYPSKFVVFELGAHLYPSAYNFVRFTSMQTNNPGQFNWTEPLAVGGDNPDYYKGKVVILVDEATVSQAEYTAMAFRGAPSAIVIGNTTAGADGNVSGISLPGGHSTRLSGIGVYYADKTPTQRVGIVPDIEVLPTLKGVMAGRDEALERAMAYIKQ